MAILREIAHTIETIRTNRAIFQVTNMQDSQRLEILLNEMQPSQRIDFLRSFMDGWQGIRSGQDEKDIEIFFPPREIKTHKLCWYEPQKGSRLANESTLILAYYPAEQEMHIPYVHFCQPLCTVRGPTEMIHKEIMPALTAGMKAVPGGKKKTCSMMYVYEA